MHPLYKLANSGSENCNGIQGIISNYSSIVIRDSNGTDFTTNDRINQRHGDYLAALAAASELGATRYMDGMPDLSMRSALDQSGWVPVGHLDDWVEFFNFNWFFAEPPEDISLFSTLNDTTYAGDFGDVIGDYFITDSDGFVKIVNCLAAEAFESEDDRLHLNARVREVEWGSDCVCVSVTENSESRKYCGQYAIVTFSIGVLQSPTDSDVTFTPAFPQDKMDTINQFEMSHYLHIFIEFSRNFWGDVEFIGHINDREGEYFPMFQYLNHIPNAFILDATLTSETADRVLRQSEEMTRQEVVDVLNNMFDLQPPLQPTDIVNLLIPDWDTNPLFLGTWNIIRPGATKGLIENLREPLEGRLYISGEATSVYHGYAHGAYLAGMNTANTLIRRTSGANGMMNMFSLQLLVAFILLDMMLIKLLIK